MKPKPEELWGKQHTDAVLVYANAAASTRLVPDRKTIETLTGPWPIMPLTICHELSRMTPYGYSFWVNEWGTNRT